MKKALAKEIYEDGYVSGYKDAVVEFLEDFLFDGESYKMSIKNHEKWKKRLKQ